MLHPHHAPREARQLLGLIVALIGLMCVVTFMPGTARRAFAQAAAPSWRYTGTFSPARFAHTAALLPSTKILSTGDSLHSHIRTVTPENTQTVSSDAWTGQGAGFRICDPVFGAPPPSVITVSGLTGRVSKITVSLTNFGVTLPRDLVFRLVGPSSQSSILMQGMGLNNGTHYNNLTLTFDDAAPALLTDTLASGTYKPATELSIFNGTSPNGEWKLSAVDLVDNDFFQESCAEFGGWSLTVTTQATPTPTPTPAATPVWSAPVNLGPVINATASDQGPALSPDGLSLYFTSNRLPSVGGFDMYVAQRASVNDPWGAPVNIGPLNTTADEGNPAFSRDGRLLFFQSKRLPSSGGIDIWVAQRNNPHDDFGWQPAVNLGPAVNSTADDNGPAYFEDIARGTRQLYFGSTRPGGPGAADIYVSEQMADGSFGPAMLVPELNSPLNENRPSIRHNGLEIFFQSNRIGSNGTAADLWVATRGSTLDAWATPVNLGDTINTASAEQNPYLSADGTTLFFSSDRSGGAGGIDLYTSTRTLPTPSWRNTGHLNTGRDSHTATLLLNGKVLVAGGNDSNGTLKSAELYDPATGTWSNTGNLNTDRAFHTATLLPGGKVLVAGGFNCGPPPRSCFELRSAELYDPAAGTWSNTGNLNVPRDSHTATLLQNGKVLVAGGFFSGGEQNRGELYDPATGTWSNTGNLNMARELHSATLLPNGKVLVAGGAINCVNFCFDLNSAELYDPAAGTWSYTGNLNATRELHTATLLPNGNVLVAAGFISIDNGQLANSAELYDPATGIWGNTGNLNTGRAYHTATLLPNGNVLIAGGFNFSNDLPNIIDSAEIYDSTTGTWSNTASLNTARRFHTATLLLNGKVLAAGGSFNVANTAELYDPAPMPGPNTVQFSAASYSAGEGAGRATITITRTGDTAAPASVDFTTVDDPAAVRCDVVNGTAYARCDYATTLDTLNFAAGETQRVVSIPLIDDAHVEGNETVQLALRNPTGATLGAQSTATLTINDNDATTGANPVFTTPFFVRQHYLDFLAREPEQGEPFTTILNGCPNVNNTDPDSPAAGCDRLNISGQFFGSPEFQLKGVYVIVFYRAAFNRLPEYAEFAQDLRAVTGATAQETFARRAAFANSFVQRPEFVNVYGALSNSAYVTTLMGRYQLTSITTPEPAQPDGTAKVTLTSADLLDRLNAGSLTRAQVLRAFVQADELSRNREAVNAFVASQYYGYLRRTPDTNGFNGWVSYLSEHPGDFRTMVNGFVNSIEYRLRFGPSN